MRLRLFSREALGIGLALAALQLATAGAIAPGKDLKESYSKLCMWDCGWYREIAEDGYHSVVPPVAQNSGLSNVAFFPAYPYLARGLHLSTGLKADLCLLVIAQIFCVVFWAALWSTLKRWRVPQPIAILAVLAVFAHPASFYLIAGYSESLFLSSLLIFVVGSSRASGSARLSASLAGAAMSATRIVGIPVSGFPVAHQLVQTLASRKAPSARDFLSPFALAMIASLGALIFLAYCKLRFGHFDLYMETQRIGWGIRPDYGAILDWKNFRFTFAFDRYATLLSGAAFVLMACIEAITALFIQRSGFKTRLPLYAAAFLIFFITISGLRSVDFKSMVRYTLPWHILIVLCLAHLVSRLPKAPRPIARIGFILFALASIFVLYYFQFHYLRDYLYGRWFA